MESALGINHADVPMALRENNDSAESDLAMWRRRAKKAEHDLEDLRRKLRALVSSDVSAEEIVEEVLKK
jgi:hypothetical protein